MQATTKNNPDDRMTIEQLAAVSGMTVRNIRAHQSHALLHSPHIQGRKGYYDKSHLEKLKNISALQEKGYSLAAIQDQQTKTELNKIETGVFSALEAWKEEGSVTITISDFFNRFPVLAKDKKLLNKVKATGMYSFNGDQVDVVWPMLLDTTEVLLNAGASMQAILALQERMLKSLQGIAQDVIGFFVEDILDSRIDCMEPDSLTKVVKDIRPYTVASFGAWFSYAIELEIANLADRSSPEKRDT